MIKYIQVSRRHYCDVLSKSLPRKNNGYWNSQENIQAFLNHLQSVFKIQNMEDWDKITKKQILNEGGGRLLNKISLFELKCLAEPKLRNNNKKIVKKPVGYWNNELNVKLFLNKLKQKENIKTVNDWKLLTTKQIINFGGRGLLDKYSLREIKILACPEIIKIIEEPKLQKSKGYWDNEENILNFIETLKEKYNLNTPEDWLKLTKKDVKIQGGSHLFSKFTINQFRNFACKELGEFDYNKEKIIKDFVNKLKNKLHLNKIDDWNSLTWEKIDLMEKKPEILKEFSLSEIKKLGYPNLNEIKVNKPSGYWNNDENIRKFILEIQNEYNLKTYDDWKNLSWKQVNNIGGSRLFTKKSLFEVKCMACPELALEIEKISKLNPKPNKYWENEENILKFLKEFQNKFNLKTPEDWNKITSNDIIQAGGSRILSKKSLFSLKTLICPEIIKFSNKSKNNPKSKQFWENEKNIKNLLDDIKEKLNLKSPHDWKNVTKDNICSFGGSSLFSRFSIYEVKCIACPEYSNFYPPNRKFDQKPKGFWDNLNNIRNFLEFVKKEYKINMNLDWYRVSKTQIQDLGGSSLLQKYTLFDLLNLVYPNENWDKKLFSNSDKRSSQRWLFLQVQKLFPDHEIIEDYFHQEVTRISGYPVQFDVFIPSKNIAFEYQGQQHYEDSPASFSSLELYKSRDLEKQQICKEKGISLIIVPYWWDNKLFSLQKICKNYNLHL